MIKLVYLYEYLPVVMLTLASNIDHSPCVCTCWRYSLGYRVLEYIRTPSTYLRVSSAFERDAQKGGVIFPQIL
jgi:hypothetical protein